jgi:Uma2 family endonuclease
MISSVLTYGGNGAALEELLKPDAEAGVEPEQRVVYFGISWARYLAIDKRLGDDRSVPQLYFLDGELEIMTTSNEHERVKKLIGDFLGDYFMEVGTEVVPRGQATMRNTLKEAGAEPDESWCFGEEKEFPDLVLEIALSSGGINKLEIYRRFKVSEVWFYRRNQIEIFALGRSGRYSKVQKSKLLRGLDISSVERCLRIHSWQQARHAFRAALAKRRRT